jgi:hypothetical protein
MKIVYKYSYLLILLLPLLLTHCGTTSEPTPPQTLKIADMWTGNLTDNDKDGYYSYFDMYFDLDINRGSREVFVLLATRFHDPGDSTDYVELFRSETFTVEEGATDDALYFGVELPSDLLPATGYDFLFLVVNGEDADEPDASKLRRITESSASDRDLLSNVPLEFYAHDVAVLLNAMGIADSIDYDGDNYKSYLQFNFILEIIGGSKEIFVVLAAREHDPGDTEGYTGYLESPPFTVDENQGNGMYNIQFPVPLDDGDFLQGGYDFLFIVFDNSVEDLRLIEQSASTTDMLNNVLLEPSDTDNTIWIYDAAFDEESEVDIDGDGYFSEAWIVFDVDEASGAGEDVYVDISYKPAGSGSYMYLGSTPTFTVNGTDLETIAVEVNQNQTFSNGSYDFKLDLMFDGYNIIEDSRDASTDTDLAGIQLELSSEDVPQELSVWNIWPSELFDNDRDGYYSSVVISTDIDVSYGEADVFMRVYYKNSEESTYTFLGETNIFHLVGNDEGDVYSIEFTGFSHGLWDLRFEILFAGSSTVELVYDDSNEPDLDDIFMETSAEDATP